MAVASTALVGTTSARLDAKGSRQYDVLYRVMTTSRNDQAVTVRRASGLPAIGQYYQAGNDWDGGAYVDNYTINLQNEEDDRKTWSVTVHYTTSERGGSQTDPTQELIDLDYPWLAPARVSMGGVDREDMRDLAYSSPSATTMIKLLNSANDPIIDGLPVPVSVPTLTIDKDFLALPTSLFDYVDTTNKSVFFGQPKWSWRMIHPRITMLFTGAGVRYYSASFEFELIDNKVLIIDRGWRALDPDSPTTTSVMVTDGFGRIASEPMPLDGDGYQQLSFLEPVYYPPGGVYKYPEKEYGDLGIPTDWDE